MVSFHVLFAGDQATGLRNEADGRRARVLVAFELCDEREVVGHCFLLLGFLEKVLGCFLLKGVSVIAV